MGRIVYFSFPAHGHVNPTLPVVQALSSRGHEVFYYSTARFLDAIRITGARFQAYSPRFAMPEQGPGAFAQVSSTLETLLELSCTVLEQHLEEVQALRPTHIAHDSFAPWGSLVAQALRVPAIASVPSILISEDIVTRYGGEAESDPRLTRQWYDEFESQCRARLSRFPLPNVPSPAQLLQTYGDLNLVYTSRAFQPAAESFEERRFRFVGPCFGLRPPAPAFPWERLDGRPLVFVSLGTVYVERPRFLARCLEELASGPWQVVMATGGTPVGDREALPKNFVVRDFVPQIEILQRAAVFVTHGGMNGVQEALYFGVPLILVPQGADQFWIAARAEELGAGVVLNPLGTHDGTIRAAVARVLSEPGFIAAAAHQGRLLRMAGGPVQAAEEIQRFVRASK